MRFSEAIRLGASLTLPLRWVLAIFDPITKEPLATCALGAAAHAAGVLKCGRYAEMLEAFPAAHEPHIFACQFCLVITQNLAGYAAHLNDNHDYSRAEVADLIEREEQRLVDDSSERTARIRELFNAKKDAASLVSK